MEEEEDEEEEDSAWMILAKKVEGTSPKGPHSLPPPLPQRKRVEGSQEEGKRRRGGRRKRDLVQKKRFGNSSLGHLPLKGSPGPLSPLVPNPRRHEVLCVRVCSPPPPPSSPYPRGHVDLFSMLRSRKV